MSAHNTILRVAHVLRTFLDPVHGGTPGSSAAAQRLIEKALLSFTAPFSCVRLHLIKLLLRGVRCPDSGRGMYMSQYERTK